MQNGPCSYRTQSPVTDKTREERNRQKSCDQSWTSSVLITLNPPHFSSPPALFEESVILKSGFLGCQVSLRQQQVCCRFQPLGISHRPRYRLLLVLQRCAGAFCRPPKPTGQHGRASAENSWHIHRHRWDAQMCPCIYKLRSFAQMWYFLSFFLRLAKSCFLFCFFFCTDAFQFLETAGVITFQLDSFSLLFYKWQARWYYLKTNA